MGYEQAVWLLEVPLVVVCRSGIASPSICSWLYCKLHVWLPWNVVDLWVSGSLS